MTEKWREQTWRILSPTDWKLAERMKGIRPGVWIVLIVAVLTSVRAARMLYHPRAAQRDEIASAIGSAGLLYGAPQVDHSGRRILYLQTSRTGSGIFVKPLADGRKQTFCQWSATYHMKMCDQVFPFSPDDALFAYAYDPDAHANVASNYLAVCRANSGEELARLHPLEFVHCAVWLTPRKLVWLGRKLQGHFGPGFHLHLLERQANGTWTDWSSKLSLTNGSCLMRLSEDTFAWLDIEGLHTMKAAPDSVPRLLKTPGQQITDCDYCPQTQQFLAVCRENWGYAWRYSLWRLKWNTNGPDDFSRLAAGADIEGAKWLNDGSGYAYLNGRTLIVKPEAGGEETALNGVSVDALLAAPGSRDLFFIGTASNQPWAGIWRYHLADHTMNNVIPWSDSPSGDAAPVIPSQGTFQAGTNTVTYYVYYPAHFDPHKKYPLLICDTTYRQSNRNSPDGPNWLSALASCGAYVVVVERPGWYRDIEDWGTNVLAVYRQLVPDPTVDADRVFLLAVCEEIHYMSRLIQKTPRLWRGLILLNPDEFTDLSALGPVSSLQKILISAGAKEGKSEVFKNYQNTACGYGIRVEVQEFPDAGHAFVSTSSIRARTRAMAKFIFND